MSYHGLTIFFWIFFIFCVVFAIIFWVKVFYFGKKYLDEKESLALEIEKLKSKNLERENYKKADMKSNTKVESSTIKEIHHHHHHHYHLDNKSKIDIIEIERSVENNIKS